MACGGRLGIGTPTKTIRVGAMNREMEETPREAIGGVTAAAESSEI